MDGARSGRLALGLSVAIAVLAATAIVLSLFAVDQAALPSMILACIAAGAAFGPIERYDADLPGSEATGELEAMANYAGQSAGVIRTRGSAAEIVREVAADADRILRTISS